ncbi:hypothetical protein OPV22_004969 [Ensete ventricosum]|uniref:Uncharacterized protein n=1 Tax=Ensete ventricosum TaxID=4639 RepID=A0AAV8RLQ0_ENSVE|nr:hypothetical protein OPV22_004969 [Ensete ventricosum]
MGPTQATNGPATFAREPCILSWRGSHVPPPLIIESVGFMWRPSGSHPRFRSSSVREDKLGFVVDAVASLPFRLHCKITTSHGYRSQETKTTDAN